MISISVCLSVFISENHHFTKFSVHMAVAWSPCYVLPVSWMMPRFHTDDVNVSSSSPGCRIRGKLQTTPIVISYSLEVILYRPISVRGRETGNPQVTPGSPLYPLILDEKFRG